jgi:hypothetical protein
MSAPDHGFVFMRTPTALARAYEESPFAGANEAYLVSLRDALPRVDPASYRGTGRYPLNASYDYKDPGWQWDKGQPRVAEELGRLAVEEALGDWRVTGEEWLIDGPWLLPDISCALQVRGFLEQPDAYELVEVALYPSRTGAASLGFDVGYWASGNFSLICDTAVWPLWHPPPMEAMSGLGAMLAGLNEAVLFPDPASAVRFRDAYRAQPWGEEEGTPWGIIEVARVDLPGSA